MIDLAGLQQAQARLADTLSPTPLVLDHALSDRLGRRVWLKGELFQRTGSFKARGALNWLRTAGSGELEGGLGAVSAGNHALGLAWAARQAGVAVTIVMPETASPFKVEGSRELAAEPGAAVGVAVLLEEAVMLPPGGDVVVVITGGNLGREELEAFL